MSDAACPYASVSAALAAGALDYADTLEIEHLTLPTPSAATLRQLREAGVPNYVLGCPIVSLREAWVRFFPAGRFDLAEPADDGTVTALLVLVRDLYEDALDVAAFVLDRPAAIYTLEGRAAFLGEHLVGNVASTFGRPLQVHRDAIEWLRADGAGVVVVDTAKAWRRLVDADVPIAAQDQAHARRLGRELTPPRRAVRVLVRRRAAA